MGKTTIEWATYTQNFWIGCEKVSAACDFCYAETWANRFLRGESLWNGNRHRTSESVWHQPFKWNKQAMFREVDEPKPRVFVNSLSDFFDNQIDPAWRAEAFDVIDACDNLDFMLLTKRPQNVMKMIQPRYEGILPKHVWLGTTVEAPDEYRRIKHLITVPACRFLSMEPLLAACPGVPLEGIDLVICGGESGPHARPMHVDWARSLRDQCAAAGVPFFFKQFGEWGPDDGPGPGGKDPILTRPVRCAWLDGNVWRFEESGFAVDLKKSVGSGEWLYRLGKTRTGRMLDGIEHNGMPAP